METTNPKDIYVTFEEAAVITGASFFTIRKQFKTLKENLLIHSLEQGEYSFENKELVINKTLPGYKRQTPYILREYAVKKWGETELGKHMAKFGSEIPAFPGTINQKLDEILEKLDTIRSEKK